MYVYRFFLMMRYKQRIAMLVTSSRHECAGFSIGVDIFLFDPECRAKPIGQQFAAPDQPPDLLLAEAQVRGGLFDRVKARHFSLPRSVGVAFSVIGSILFALR